MKYDFEPITDAAHTAEQSQRSVIRLLVQALEQMERRVRDLEERGDQTSDEDDDFSERVLQVLRVRSGSAREGLGLLGYDSDFDLRVLSVIEENSFTVYTHIEAEIEGKLDDMTQSYAFSEAVEDAVKGSIVSTVEDVISELGVIDPEEIVRAGLKAII